MLVSVVATVPATVTGHAANVYIVLVADACDVLGGGSVGMEGGNFDRPLRVAYFADANSGYSGKRFTRNFVYRTWVFRYTLVAITLDCWRVFWPAF